MIQIGPIKYTKKEERIILICFILGLATGIPLGSSLSYYAGLLKKLTLAESDIFGWGLYFLKAGLIFATACWATGIISCIVVSRRNGMKSAPEIRKMLFGTLLIPLTMLFPFLVFAFVTVPLDSFLHIYFGLGESYAIDVLVFSPFVVLFVAIFVPDSKPGKALRRFINHKKARKKDRACGSEKPASSHMLDSTC